MLPNDPALTAEEQIETLDDALTDALPTAGETEPQPQVEEPAKPMTTAQVLGAVGMFSSFGLPPEVAESYRKDLEGDVTLTFLLEMLGLADALASYGIGAGGGKMPDWLKVVLGTGVLGFFLYQKRMRYGGIASAPVVAAGAGGNVTGFDGNSAFGAAEEFSATFPS
jgi:hypothetical protein